MSPEFSENNLCELVRSIGGDLVEEVTLIDNFTNKKTGRTSNCYRIVYRCGREAEVAREGGRGMAAGKPQSDKGRDGSKGRGQQLQPHRVQVRGSRGRGAGAAGSWGKRGRRCTVEGSPGHGVYAAVGCKAGARGGGRQGRRQMGAKREGPETWRDMEGNGGERSPPSRAFCLPHAHRSADRTLALFAPPVLPDLPTPPSSLNPCISLLSPPRSQEHGAVPAGPSYLSRLAHPPSTPLLIL